MEQNLAPSGPLGRDVSLVAGDHSRWPKLTLSSTHQKLWDETRTATLWSVPSFSDIWYSMMIDKDGQAAWFTDSPGIGKYAATDDKIMYLNPNNFFKDFNLQERVFVCVHEVCHAMFNHCGISYSIKRTGHIRYSDGVELPYHDQLMNMAMDYVINDMLIVAKIGEMPKVGLHNPSLITGDDNVLDAYRKLFKAMGGKINKNGKGEAPGAGRVPANAGFDKHLEPGQGRGKTPEQAQSERHEQEWDNTIAAAMASAKLRGHLPENLERKFIAKMQPQANWEEVYALAVTRKIGNAGYSWELLDPQLMQRNIGSPGRIAYGCNLVIVAIDSSGSTFQSTVDTFIVEIRGILDTIRPKRVIITQCDAKIHEWSEIEPGSYDEMSVKVKGGGGTDFCPVFERIEKEYEEPDMLIYLTDMEGDFPAKAPGYPVVWGSVTKNATAPFGDVVFIPQQHKGE